MSNGDFAGGMSFFDDGGLKFYSGFGEFGTHGCTGLMHEFDVIGTVFDRGFDESFYIFGGFQFPPSCYFGHCLDRRQSLDFAFHVVIWWSRVVGIAIVGSPFPPCTSFEVLTSGDLSCAVTTGMGQPFSIVAAKPQLLKSAESANSSLDCFFNLKTLDHSLCMSMNVVTPKRRACRVVLALPL